MTNATGIVLQILKQKSQRVLSSGIVVTFVQEFVNVMQGSRDMEEKCIECGFVLNFPPFRGLEFLTICKVAENLKKSLRDTYSHYR